MPRKTRTSRTWEIVTLIVYIACVPARKKLKKKSCKVPDVLEKFSYAMRVHATVRVRKRQITQTLLRHISYVYTAGACQSKGDLSMLSIKEK